MNTAIDISGINDMSVIQDSTFFIDTNALIWAFYPKSNPQNRRAAAYSNFISNIISDNRNIVIATSNLLECTYVIEKIELDLYNRFIGSQINMKQFRKINAKRSSTKAEIDLVLLQIHQIPQISVLSDNYDENSVIRFMCDFNNHRLDYYDFNLWEKSQSNGYAIITDDGDFNSIAINANIYTANPCLLHP